MFDNPERIIYNIAYHMGLIYEDIVYLTGGDIVFDNKEPIS